MIIKKIEGILPVDLKAVEDAFSTVAPEKIACCNWPAEYPYAPEVSFRIFHTGSWLMIRYEVFEKYTAARVSEDNGEVWTDSCVECFIAPDRASFYNIEATCIGRILISNRKSRTEGIIPASQEIMDKVVRIPSLGTEPFEEREGNNRWTLTLAVPPQALFRHEIKDWSGQKMRMNLYKCGDKLSVPHFLSWKPIHTEYPDFHRPEFFTDVEFE